MLFGARHAGVYVNAQARFEVEASRKTLAKTFECDNGVTSKRGGENWGPA